MEARLQRVHNEKREPILWPCVKDPAPRFPPAGELNLPGQLGRDGNEDQSSLLLSR
jgi:hypothetical protein